MKEIIIHKLSLPPKVRAMTIPDSNGDFTVILNSDLNDAIQKNALAHELRHIDLDHFYNEDYVAQNEFEVIGAADAADSRSWSDIRSFSEQGLDFPSAPAPNSSCAQPAKSSSRNVPLKSDISAQIKESGAPLPGRAGSDLEDGQNLPPAQTEKVLLPTSILRSGKQVVMRVARRRPLEDLLSETAPDPLNRPL